MLLGFKRQFEAFVVEGSKTHTIRARRKIRPKPGETCHCYGDARQTTMHLLGRWKCNGVQDIQIKGVWEKGNFVGEVYIDHLKLDEDELDELAWRDGFRPAGGGHKGAFVLMMNFWSVTHGRRYNRYGATSLKFDGEMIHWDFSQPMPPKAKRVKAKRA